MFLTLQRILQNEQLFCHLLMLSDWTNMHFCFFSKELTLYSINTHFDSDNCTPFVHIFDIILLFAEFEEPKIGIGGKGLS